MLIFLLGGAKSEGEEESVTISPPFTVETAATSSTQPTLKFTKELKNLTRIEGDSLRLRCDVSGPVPATNFEWLKHGVPMFEDRRMKVKTKLKGDPQWSQLRIRDLETLDKAFYTCRVSNGIDTIESSAVISVNMDTGGNRQKWNNDDDYDEEGLLPQTYSEPDFIGNVEFEGGKKPSDIGGGGNSRRVDGKYKNLKPDENVGGDCQPYLGSVCSRFIGNSYIFVTRGLNQEYIERKLAQAFSVITESSELSDECRPFAVPSICLSTFPMCDRRTNRPRKLCRDECELLEGAICRKELAIARQYAALEAQLVLPECEKMPAIGSAESANCVRLNMSQAVGLIEPTQTCFDAVDFDGDSSYRGMLSSTESGQMCLPWNTQLPLKANNPFDHLDLIGGHNFCRSPSSIDGVSGGGPWCFATTGNNDVFKERCEIPRCTIKIDLYLHILAPALGAVVLLGLIIGLCCMRSRKRNSKPSKAAAAAATTSNAVNGNQSQNGTLEMNSLLPQQPQSTPGQIQGGSQRQVQLREFPFSSLRFMEELGEGKNFFSSYNYMFNFESD